METWMSLLKRELGDEFDAGQITDLAEELDAHSYDTWPVAKKWRQQQKSPYRPEMVVHPRNVRQISRLLAWASQKGIAVTPWGAGSGVTGAALPMQGGISLDLSAMDRILVLDETNLLVKVEAGILGHHLEKSLNSNGYTLNHSPQSLDRSTVGGWVATRATGQFSSRWGGIENLVCAMTVVLADGTVIETRLTPRAAVGPDLNQVFIGSEGILGVLADVTLKIFPIAEQRIFETLSFATIEAGLVAMRHIMQAGLNPFLVRFYDEDEAKRLSPGGNLPGNIMLLGFEGIEAVAKAEYQTGLAICKIEGAQVLGPEAALAWMERRFDFSTIENILEKPGGFAETIEVAHFWDGILGTYQALKNTLSPLADEVFGHFSHVYPQGTSLYMILFGEAPDAASAEKNLMAIWEAAMQTCLEQEASISHHHGVGLARLPFVRQDLGNSFVVLERLKRALDPAGILNPGKFGINQ